MSLLSSTGVNLQVRKPTATKQCASKPNAPAHSNDIQGKSGLVEDCDLLPEKKVSIQGIGTTASKNQSTLLYLTGIMSHLNLQYKAVWMPYQTYL